MILFLSCKTEEPQNPPTLITNAASNITFRIATLNGEVTNEGFSAVSERGFVYSEKNSNPSVSDSERIALEKSVKRLDKINSKLIEVPEFLSIFEVD